jgi:hypothetical protein
MNKKIAFLSLVFVFVITSACVLGPINLNSKTIDPSSTIISEDRPVSGFTGIELSTFGKVIVTQASEESLTVKGSDNVVPLIVTSVVNGVLVIKTDEQVNVLRMNDENVLTLTVTVKDLNSITVSGAGQVTMDSLNTTDLRISMSGAGQVVMGNLAAKTVNMTVSGVGEVEVSGEAASATIDISGAGDIKAPDLKLQTANVTISGIGGAQIWVTDHLTGTISGVGDVNYYGQPVTDTNSSGIGQFKPLGNK